MSQAYSADAPLTGLPPPGRGVFCNRTLNLRSIGAIGYDMDYTLIHYHVKEWEQRAYNWTRQNLLARGWPVGELRFDPDFVIRGLVIDRELGNIVKANRFGYVKRAAHGTRMLDFDEQRRAYSRTRVDLSENRWVFLNTLFSLSEGCMYAQLVELLDAHQLPEVLGYTDLYGRLKAALDEEHVRGELKAEIMADPDRFVELDPDLPLALLDQRQAGKKLLLITNSEWHYTRFMMAYAFDRFLPAGMTWRELFDVVIVSAAKPDFFTSRMPAFEVVNEDGLLKPALRGFSESKLGQGAIFYGANASLVEKHLGLSGEEILFVGDHPFGDVHVSKSVLRWRTALILRELEDELRAQLAFESQSADLAQRMAEKERVELRHAQWRLLTQRRAKGYGPQEGPPTAEVEAETARLRAQLIELDAALAPLAQQSAVLQSARWGLLLRTGNDKSQLARQLERHADIYLSRVSNFLYVTPYRYLRSARGSLPHDLGAS